MGLYEEAVKNCFRHKWRRNDILRFCEEYGGVDSRLIELEVLKDGNDFTVRQVAVRNIACVLSDVVEGIERGKEPEDMDPVVLRRRPDGISGKMRDIALLCILHQLLGHAELLMIEPLVMARLFPTQHASLPGRGQTKLKNQAHGYLLRESLGANFIRKTDVVHAYQTLMYSVIIRILKEEIPKARTAIALMTYLGKLAPDGHLIIGGYLDAWLFNFAMSYAIADAYKLTYTRRGRTHRRAVRIEAYMDDFAIFASSIKNLKAVVKEIRRFCNNELGVDIRTTTGCVKMLSVEEEKRRKSLAKPSQRGVPMLDMAGYRVSRTHVTIRRKVFRRARRQFLRAYEELEKDGTLMRYRAKKVIAYNGYVKQTDSRKLKEKYHVDELMRTAKKVSRFYSVLNNRKRKEQMYDLFSREVKDSTRKDTDQDASRNALRSEDGGQH